MSGEAGGALIGGLLLLGAVPVILGAAAVVGAAAGIGAIGKSVAKEAERRRERQRLELDNCSAELQELYGRMNAALARQDSQWNDFHAQMGAQLDGLSKQLQDSVKRGENSEQLNRTLRAARSQTSEMIARNREEMSRRIEEESRRETAAILSQMRTAEQARMDAANWREQTEAAKAGQKAMAESLLRDAQASVRLLERLDDGDAGFAAQTQAMRRACESAGTAIANGAYQTAAAGAQQVITRCASLALTHEQQRREEDEIRLALTSRLQGLRAELRSQSVVKFQDPRFGEKTERLDSFTQGEFSRIEKEVDEALLRAEQTRNVHLLRQALEDVENRLVPRVSNVIRVGHEKLLFYYERLHALQVIAEHMKEQDYTVDWAQSAGNDVTQKLALHFRNERSGNSVAVALDENVSAQELGDMAMEVMFYYHGGRDVTEEEKQRIRQGMLQALSREGISGDLHCTGSRNRSADNQTLNSLEAVQSMEVRPIPLLN
ncbi:MAG: hypothetical protein IJQ81_09700 [Oscillibacter sp.]|nr:hypothetical protein [Oscillibacter sp.]